jgi:hypothetical protein
MNKYELHQSFSGFNTIILNEILVPMTKEMIHLGGPL